MPDKPVCNKCPSTPWRPHSHKHQQILQLHKLQRLPIIPSTMIQILPNQLNRWLSAIRLLLGHVQIINEHNTLLTNGWPVVALSSFLHLAVDSVLGLVGAGLG